MEVVFSCLRSNLNLRPVSMYKLCVIPYFLHYKKYLFKQSLFILVLAVNTQIHWQNGVYYQSTLQG